MPLFGKGGGRSEAMTSTIGRLVAAALAVCLFAAVPILRRRVSIPARCALTDVYIPPAWTVRPRGLRDALT